MATNVTTEYQLAEEDYRNARTIPAKLVALSKMLQLVPKHKASEKLQQQIKQRISKLKAAQEKEAQKKKGGHSLSIKKEGAAQVVLIGTTNTGKSTLLHTLTGAHVEIASYPYTTTIPEVGIMDYKGVKIQIIELPAIIPCYGDTKNGPTFLAIAKQADLLIIFFHSPQEKQLIDREIADVHIPRLIYNNQNDFSRIIWEHLNLIKIFTKQPGKPAEKLPIAFPKHSTVNDVATRVHKDFLHHFRFARIFGKSAKFQGQTAGLDHVLADDDIVELHLKK